MPPKEKKDGTKKKKTGIVKAIAYSSLHEYGLILRNLGPFNVVILLNQWLDLFNGLLD